MEKPVFKFRHVGINTSDEAQLQQTARLLALLFGQETRVMPNSLLAGGNIELMRSGSPGEKGHLAFNVESVEEGLEYLSSLGCEAEMESALYDEDGKLKLVYLKDEIAGFAVHLFRQKL